MNDNNIPLTIELSKENKRLSEILVKHINNGDLIWNEDFTEEFIDEEGNKQRKTRLWGKIIK